MSWSPVPYTSAKRSGALTAGRMRPGCMTEKEDARFLPDLLTRDPRFHFVNLKHCAIIKELALSYYIGICTT